VTQDRWTYKKETCLWTCPKCGGPAELRSPTSERVVDSVWLAGRDRVEGEVRVNDYEHSGGPLLLHVCETCATPIDDEERERRRLAIKVAKALKP
jgi:hypothetical protein